jgi:hypothetical protein
VARQDERVRYVIVRRESDNEFGFDSRTEALAAQRRSVAAHGLEVVCGWHLMRSPRRGEWKLVATSKAPLSLVRGTAQGSAAA